MQTEETESDEYGNMHYPLTERNKISGNGLYSPMQMI